MQLPQLSNIRLVPYLLADSDFNMAADELLLESEGSILRFYGWKKPTLSVGRFSANPEDIDRKFLANNQIPMVKRPTGGQAVFHHLELTYAFCGDQHPGFEGVLKTYRKICAPLLGGLEKLGVEARMKDSDKKRVVKSSVCFNEISPYEVAVGGKKLIGSAQCRKKGRFLQHGSILLGLDLNLWAKIWKLNPQEVGLDQRITALDRLIAPTVHAEILAETLTQEFSRLFKAEIQEKEFTPSELGRIEVLRSKYRAFH